jgi:hypothetical protein
MFGDQNNKMPNVTVVIRKGLAARSPAPKPVDPLGIRPANSRAYVASTVLLNCEGTGHVPVPQRNGTVAVVNHARRAFL